MIFIVAMCAALLVQNVYQQIAITKLLKAENEVLDAYREINRELIDGNAELARKSIENSDRQRTFMLTMLGELAKNTSASSSQKGNDAQR